MVMTHSSCPGQAPLLLALCAQDLTLSGGGMTGLAFTAPFYVDGSLMLPGFQVMLWDKLTTFFPMYGEFQTKRYPGLFLHLLSKVRSS